MTHAPVSDARPPRLGAAAVEVLESLHQHRLLSTVQVHRLHAPAASRRWVQRLLARLHQTGLADRARGLRGLGVWHLTEAGMAAVEAIPARAETRRAPTRPDQAAGSLQQHTLAVNETGVAFVQAARERGDDCGAFAWRHEVAHSLGPPPGRSMPEQLIADAVLAYHLTGPHGASTIHYRFVEVDRANRSTVDLASRLARYGRLYRRTVATDDPPGGTVLLWETLYPAFPTVLLVLAGQPRHRLEHRRDTVLALCSQHPDLTASPEVEIAACPLDDLRARGPFAAIWRTAADPDAPADWLGQTGDDR